MTLHIATRLQPKRRQQQARIAACREYGNLLLPWERGYLASLDICLRREPVLNSIQLGYLHEIEQRAGVTVTPHHKVSA